MALPHVDFGPRTPTMEYVAQTYHRVCSHLHGCPNFLVNALFSFDISTVSKKKIRPGTAGRVVYQWLLSLGRNGIGNTVSFEDSAA